MAENLSLTTVVDCCSKHALGQIDPGDKQNVIAQMRVEGHKRLEAFLFEPYVVNAVLACCGADQTSTGWSFQYDNKNKPHFWFKLLQKGSSINQCDSLMIEFLNSQGCEITILRFRSVEKSFRVWRQQEGKWTDAGSLSDVLAQLLGVQTAKAGPKNYTTIDRRAQNVAIQLIEQTFTDNDLYNLSVSRLLVNCYLYPWFRRQPMDIDVCCIVNEKLRMIEFKRKYPTANLIFGIDNDPHGKLIDWLSLHGLNLTHFVLCDPLWDKNVSPAHLLEPESVTAEYAYWLGAELNTENTHTESTQQRQLRTSGKDSGFTGGEREQRALALSMFHLIGRGLNPQFVCEYLSDSSLAVTGAMLEQARDMARRLRNNP